jgi:hypothetical protein
MKFCIFVISFLFIVVFVVNLVDCANLAVAAHDAKRRGFFSSNFLPRRKQGFQHAFSAQEKGALERAEFGNRVAFQYLAFVSRFSC